MAPLTFRSATLLTLLLSAALQVIPIVADTSSPEGMAHARSTISAYCSSHDLVLRALVVVPSILDSPSAPADEHEEPPASPSHRAEQSSGSRERTESETGSYLGRGNEALSPPISPGGQARAQAHAQDLALLNSKLRRDVSDTLALVHALVPTLRRDRGRVVGLVPAGFGAEIGLSRWAGEESGDAHHLPKSASPTRMGKGVMGREVVRDALRTMWAELAVQLAPDGVSVSQVVTGECPKEHFVLLIARASLDADILGRANSAPLLDRTAKSPVPEARSAPHRTLSHRLLQLLSSWDRALFSPDESVLFRSVRAVLQRSYPRHTYYVGIQSRVLDALAVVPGAYWVKRRVARYVTGLDGGA